MRRDDKSEKSGLLSSKSILKSNLLRTKNKKNNDNDSSTNSHSIKGIEDEINQSIINDFFTEIPNDNLNCDKNHLSRKSPSTSRAGEGRNIDFNFSSFFFH